MVSFYLLSIYTTDMKENFNIFSSIVLMGFFSMLRVQVMIMVVIPCVGATANFAKNFLRIIVLVQYVPRIIRVLPMIVGQSASGFIFESAWANFFINLLMYVLAGHVVGSCWYLFGLQVSTCVRACSVVTFMFPAVLLCVVKII